MNEHEIDALALLITAIKTLADALLQIADVLEEGYSEGDTIDPNDSDEYLARGL